jgi:hypothetical protein
MAAYDLSPLMDNLIKQKTLQRNMFSFYLTLNEGQSDSVFTLGGVDESLFKVFKRG